MMHMATVTNIVIAGVGGQGVILASDLLSEAAFIAGLDVKKAEVHGMSQRGGSVNSDIRFGQQVWSPMIPDGTADFLLVLEPTQGDPNRHRLSPSGTEIVPAVMDGVQLPHPRTLNVAMLGVLSRHLDLPMDVWTAAMNALIPARILDMNHTAFATGRSIGERTSGHA